MNLSLRLNKRVLLQRRTEGQDEAGQPVEAWVNVVTTGDGKIWAEIKDASGREFIAAGATQNEVLTTITIRQRPGVVAEMRAVHGAEVYKIKAVLIGKDGRSLSLMCSRGSL